jgi:hypothetical protein
VKALQRHIQGLLLDSGCFGREAQLLQRLDTDSDRVGGLADGIGCANRPVN